MGRGVGDVEGFRVCITKIKELVSIFFTVSRNSGLFIMASVKDGDSRAEVIESATSSLLLSDTDESGVLIENSTSHVILPVVRRRSRD